MIRRLLLVGVVVLLHLLVVTLVVVLGGCWAGARAAIVASENGLVMT